MKDYVQDYALGCFDESLHFDEFNKLVKMIEEAGWKHKVKFLHGGMQVVIFSDDGSVQYDDAVIHSFSNGRQAGLLETYDLGNCNGWEHAEEVFDGWKERWYDED